jgi:mannose-1-phosphate guanylyltransferase/mannose-6-phosphate isomerase
MASVIQPVILAGGGGTRLWPLSREHYPKQFLSLAGEHTLLQQTLTRLEGIERFAADVEIRPPLIVTNEAHRFQVAEQARVVDKQLGGILLEPAARNTAPALTAAAMAIIDQVGDVVILAMPADHVIVDTAAFQRAVATGLPLAEQDWLTTFGIVPDRPETGYGYIRRGEELDGQPGVYRLAGFVEKPDEKTARGYLESGGYAWNGGIFMMRAGQWLKAIRDRRVDIYKSVESAYLSLSRDGEFLRLDAQAFEACPADSIDYAVMEPLANGQSMPLAVIDLEAGWSDIGSWASLADITSKDERGNSVLGDGLVLDSDNTLVLSDQRLACALGCRDMIIVETADAVLVAPKERAQDVKQVVERLHQQGREERLVQRRVYRPWGSYETVDAGPRFQVKRIVVNPGAQLSLQMHHHRAEHWVVVKGTAKVTRGDDNYLVTENESTYIPLGVKHRLENPGTIPLELIEVQSGPYLGEDDIVRFKDVYNRS